MDSQWINRSLCLKPGVVSWIPCLISPSEWTCFHMTEAVGVTLNTNPHTLNRFHLLKTILRAVKVQIAIFTIFSVKVLIFRFSLSPTIEYAK